MYSFFPQLLIFISIVGILVIFLRKIPGVSELLSKTSLQKLPEGLRNLIRDRFWPWFKAIMKKLWQYAVEVKDLSKRPAATFQSLSQRFRFSNLHLPKPKLRFLKTENSIERLLVEAQEAAENSKYQEAERLFIRILKKDQANEAAFFGLGRLYLANKKYEEAAETYKFLLKYHPENDSYYSGLAQAYFGQKLYDQAVESYERAIELAPENPKRYINLGLTLEAKKHLEEAILNYRKACEIEKDNPQFLLVLAEALAKKGDEDEAEGLLEQILQIEPTNHAAREKLMQIKF